MSEGEIEATDLLSSHASGDPQAASKLLPIVYDELRALAARRLGDERENHTLQPTALVHEAYMRLIDCERMDWQGKTHFLAMAATTMRRILVEHARAKRTTKRGGEYRRVSLTGDRAVAKGNPLDVVALSDSLEKLARVSERQAKVVELRFFGGLTVQESAAVLRVSADTVKSDWRIARAWLGRELKDEGNE